ncbi:MAG: 7-carboxy-7-deazaguanine synthase, partial [Mesorhizobium sp.]
LWSGREGDRKRAFCGFCDTDFVGVDGPGGGQELALAVEQALRGSGPGQRLVVLTGGEPLLQIDKQLREALHSLAFEIAVETNGTIPALAGIDWLCVSPKCNARLVVTAGDELKLVYPQIGAEPEQFEVLSFEHLLLQPMDGPGRDANTAAAVAYCLANPRWRLSFQTHKLLGIP